MCIHCEGKAASTSKLPRKYPHFLKPIPVNTRSTARVLASHIAADQKDVQRWLYSTWNAQKSALKYQEIRNAIRDGEMSKAVINRWQQDYSKFVVEKLAPQWKKSLLAGGKEMEKSLYNKLGFQVNFPEAGKRITQWVEKRGASEVVRITKLQRQAIREVINEYAVRQGMGPDELARHIRPLIGLTPKQAMAVMRHREALIKEGLPAKKVEHLTQNYEAYLHRLRAENIAVTEINTAFNRGMYEEMKHAKDTGIITSRIRKVWAASGDERMCDECEDLDGTTVGFEDSFTDDSDDLVPPLHVKCHCTIIYEIESVALPVSGAA